MTTTEPEKIRNLPCSVPWCIALTARQYCRAHANLDGRTRRPPLVSRELARRYAEETAAYNTRLRAARDADLAAAARTLEGE